MSACLLNCPARRCVTVTMGGTVPLGVLPGKRVGGHASVVGCIVQ